MIDITLAPGPIDLPKLLNAVEDDGAGAVALFLGRARNSSSEPGRATVIGLDYEAYGPMADREMEIIASEAVERFEVLHLVLHHRTGSLKIGDAVVAVVVATAHRAASFDACRYVIEELKQRVPIWKKEIFEDGSEWVNARP